MEKDKLQNLKKSLDQFTASCQKMRASNYESKELDTDDKIREAMWKVQDEIHERMEHFAKNMYNMMDELYTSMYKHENGHMPKLTAGQMQKLLNSCGAGEDYVIQKPSVYVSASRRGENLVASYRKDNNE